MKLAAALLIVCLYAISLCAQRTTRTRTYVRKNGTIVHTHRRTKANRLKSDNWSTRGNTNPDTGKKGRKKI